MVLKGLNIFFFKPDFSHANSLSIGVFIRVSFISLESESCLDLPVRVLLVLVLLVLVLLVRVLLVQSSPVLKLPYPSLYI